MILRIIRAFLALFIGLFTPEVEYKILRVFEKHHGIVLCETYEGFAYDDDEYVIEVDGWTYTIGADDLSAGDLITVWFDGDRIVKVLYGWR